MDLSLIIEEDTSGLDSAAYSDLHAPQAALNQLLVTVGFATPCATGGVVFRPAAGVTSLGQFLKLHPRFDSSIQKSISELCVPYSQPLI